MQHYHGYVLYGNGDVILKVILKIAITVQFAASYETIPACEYTVLSILLAEYIIKL